MLERYTLFNILFFSGIIIIALSIDLFSHRKDTLVTIKNAAIWSSIWVLISLAFAFYIGKTHGVDKASLFIAGYLLEQSLSVDNLFVIMAILTNFAVKEQYQHRVLFYGIIGAIILRFIFIAAGTTLLLLGKWVLAFFGVLVMWSAWHMYQASKKEANEIIDYTHHWSVKLTSRFIPIHPMNVGNSFFTKIDGKIFITPLMLCLIIINIVDIIFAFDSVPAIIAITQDPFLVYTSNIFAILGLRSMFFLLSAAKRYLCHLEKSVIFILIFIGFKMLIGVFDLIHLSSFVSLSVVIFSLFIGIISSIMFPKRD
ncbi:MAG: TerC/Alx family metal homeostasis membrane protein [Nitrospirae bacterium]|nr:TerC/Alx family metal homeostasis membrane protein [Nitrospirota bacterium]